MKSYRINLLLSAWLIGMPLCSVSMVYAATPINFNQQSIHQLRSLLSAKISDQHSAIAVEETSRTLDFKNTLHVRMKQTYLGHAVLGGETVVHIPHGNLHAKSLFSYFEQPRASIDGVMYQNIQADLSGYPARIMTQAQKDLALQKAISINRRENQWPKETVMNDGKVELIVYIDSVHGNQAHWAFKVSFAVTPTLEAGVSSKPVYILDADSFIKYVKWDRMQTLETINLVANQGGGVGGNKKTGKLFYDGLTNHLPKLTIKRDEESKRCYWRNESTSVKQFSRASKLTTMNFPCVKVDDRHDHIYWIDEKDAVNEGYGPASDALFGSTVIQAMYRDWYQLPVLADEDGKPMVLTMVVHKPYYENAYWDGEKMVFGDGLHMFYPLTSLDIAAHEISHGFTEQHSQLNYYGQSGGMNESFSDMAAQAAEFFAYGKNDWLIGANILKTGEALRYMDQPSKDCQQKLSSTLSSACSIDDASQYPTDPEDELDVHYSSGVYNRLFYLISTSENWNVKKAFDVMVQANQHYWLPNTNFSEGACGVLKATRDYGYDLATVKKAISTVKIDIQRCDV